MASPSPHQRVREKNYTGVECLALSKAFMNISEDPIANTGQRAATFWDRIKDESHRLAPSDCPRRTPRSLQTKWSEISCDVSKFIGFHRSIVDANPTGVTEEDIIQRALDIFKTTLNKKFPYLECFHYLKSFPKFSTVRSSQVISLDSDDVEEEPAAKRQRPLGIKAAKAARTEQIQHATRDSDVASLAQATQRLAEAQIQRSESYRDQVELTVMQQLQETNPELYQQYIRLRGEAILARLLHAQVSTSNPVISPNTSVGAELTEVIPSSSVEETTLRSPENSD